MSLTEILGLVAKFAKEKGLSCPRRFQLEFDRHEDRVNVPMSILGKGWNAGQKRADMPKTPTVLSVTNQGKLQNELLPIADKLVLNYRGPSIYFLIRNNIVVYVGCSITPNKRVKQHKHGHRKTTAKDFDRYVIYPVSIDDLLQQERNFVALLNPEYNRNLKVDQSLIRPQQPPANGSSSLFS